MKKNLTNKAKALMVVGAIGVLGFSVVAAPVIEEVKAQFKYNLSYTLNGKNVLEGKGGLVYKDQVYVPLRDVANTLGAKVEYTNGQISMTQGEAVATTPQSREITEVPAVADTVEIAKAKVIEVNVEASQITVLPQGLEDKMENYIVLNVDAEHTAIAHEKNRMRYTINEIAPGMEIKAVHASIMTMSLPAQTPAISITVLGDSATAEVEPNLAICPIGYIEDTIIEINKENKTFTVGDAKEPESQLIFKVLDTTSFQHKKNKKAYRFEDLKVGEKIGIEAGSTMTTSVPAQLDAMGVVFLD